MNNKILISILLCACSPALSSPDVATASVHNGRSQKQIKNRKSPGRHVQRKRSDIFLQSDMKRLWATQLASIFQQQAELHRQFQAIQKINAQSADIVDQIYRQMQANDIVDRMHALNKEKNDILAQVPQRQHKQVKARAKNEVVRVIQGKIKANQLLVTKINKEKGAISSEKKAAMKQYKAQDIHLRSQLWIQGNDGLLDRAKKGINDGKYKDLAQALTNMPRYKKMSKPVRTQIIEDIAFTQGEASDVPVKYNVQADIKQLDSHQKKQLKRLVGSSVPMNIARESDKPVSNAGAPSQPDGAAAPAANQPSQDVIDQVEQWKQRSGEGYLVNMVGVAAQQYANRHYRSFTDALRHMLGHEGLDDAALDYVVQQEDAKRALLANRGVQAPQARENNNEDEQDPMLIQGLAASQQDQDRARQEQDALAQVYAESIATELQRADFQYAEDVRSGMSEQDARKKKEQRYDELLTQL